MRYSPSDKTEIIRLVEQSHLPARRTLDKLGIPRSSFYRWYDRYQRGGPEDLADRPSRPDRVWNASQRLSSVKLSTGRWMSRNWAPIDDLIAKSPVFRPMIGRPVEDPFHIAMNVKYFALPMWHKRCPAIARPGSHRGGPHCGELR
jgi:hypothetical protein